ncbi:TPA: hypothetical protein MW242_002894 [Acinetobacter baumannii]|nr:hypothetical protein [Acinetobacter baumannii]
MNKLVVGFIKLDFICFEGGVSYSNNVMVYGDSPEVIILSIKDELSKTYQFKQPKSDGSIEVVDKDTKARFNIELKLHRATLLLELSAIEQLAPNLWDCGIYVISPINKESRHLDSILRYTEFNNLYKKLPT